MTKTPETISDDQLDACAGGDMQNIKDVLLPASGSDGSLGDVQTGVNVDLSGALGGSIGEVSTVAPAGTPWAKDPLTFKF